MASESSAKICQLSLETFKDMRDEDAVRFFDECFRDELRRLQDAKPSVETAEDSPAGSLTEKELTPSRLLFGSDYAEVNRTLVSLLVLRWLLVGDYERFVLNQPKATTLARDSFAELRKHVVKTIKDSKSLQALAVITVLNDIGKDPSLAEDIVAHGDELPHQHNHDDVVYAAAKADMLPLLNLLAVDLRQDVILGLEMGAKLNIPQLAQAENVPGSLQHIQLMRGHERAFELKFLEVLLDVAGAAAQVDARGAMVMTEPVYQGLAVCRRALMDLLRGQNSPREAYDQVLTFRGRMVEGGSFKSLSLKEPHERALLRLLAMGRIATPEKAVQYKKAFDSLPNPVCEQLATGMNADGYDDSKAVLPYYAPALFAEATRAAKNASDEDLVNVLASLMRFLARIYQAKPLPDETEDILERDLYFAHDTITSEAFVTNPQVLDKIDIPFERK